MTSSNTLKKIVSVGAAMLLAVGGSLTSATSASAAVPTPQSGFGGGGFFSAQPTAYMVNDTALASSGYWDTRMAGSVNAATHEWFSCASASALITDTSACTSINGGSISATTNQGQVLSTTYTVQASDIGRWLKVKVIVTAPVQMGDGGTSAPSIFTSANAVLAAPTATFDANGGVAGSITSLTGGIIWLPSLAHGGSGALPTRANCFFGGWGTAANSINPEYAMSATQLLSSRTYYAIWTGGAQCLQNAPSAGSSTPKLSAEQAKNVLKPVPAAVQPLVPAFIALNKPMASLGGKVALSAGDFTGLVSAKIAGKSLDFILGKTGQITMTVPQGEAGKTADLVLTFNTGSIILQDAIKYVAPVVVAEVPARPISITSTSKAFSEEALSEIRQAAFANVKNTAIACVAYAAADTASAKAAAKANAAKVCEIANKANSDLAITEVTVVVDKLKARTQGVGIKVYKADN